jgi:hypothetical protein
MVFRGHSQFASMLNTATGSILRFTPFASIESPEFPDDANQETVSRM